MEEATTSSLNTSNCCECCERVFNHPSLLYSCNNNHYYCYHCYKKERTSTCLHRNCGLEMYRLDLMRENILKEQQNAKRMFPEPQKIFEKLSKERLSQASSISLYKNDFPSKRPLTCPYPDCNKLISVSLIDTHFRCDHSNVVSIRTYLGNRNGLEFNPFCTRYDRNVCILLIYILHDERDNETQQAFCGWNTNMNGDNMSKPIMFLMAAKNSLKFFNASEEKNSDDIEDDFNMANNTFISTDKLLLWITSSVTTRCKYTLVASTPSRAVRLKYHGCISHINENSIKLWETGKGLILNYSHVVGMTKNGTNPLMLDFVIHKNELE